MAIYSFAWLEDWNHSVRYDYRTRSGYGDSIDDFHQLNNESDSLATTGGTIFHTFFAFADVQAIVNQYGNCILASDDKSNWIRISSISGDGFLNNSVTVTFSGRVTYFVSSEKKTVTTFFTEVTQTIPVPVLSIDGTMYSVPLYRYFVYETSTHTYGWSREYFGRASDADRFLIPFTNRFNPTSETDRINIFKCFLFNLINDRLPYRAVVDSFTGGSASVSSRLNQEGDVITVSISMAAGYAVDKNTTNVVMAGTFGTGETIPITWINDEAFTFVMPRSYVRVRIGSTQLTAYNITKKSQGYGTFTTSPANSQYETRSVTITTVPEAGYRVKYVTVSNPASGTEYAVANVSTNTYRFTMPSSDVLVSVKFWDGDPYSPGDQDDGTGGDGDFDGNSDRIPLDPTPTITIANSGMISLFNPTADEVKSFGNFLWSALLDIDTIKRIFTDPIDNIISLHMLPIQINHASNPDNVKFAGIPSGVQMRRVTTQYHNIDMGSMDITKYYDSALDYSPYTTIKIFLPYVGEVELNTDEIMGKTINLRYRVDALSGKCIAFILVNNDVLYQFPGQMSMFIPLSAANYGRIIGAGAGLAGVLIGGLAGGAAGLAAGFMASGKKTAVEGLEQSISAAHISPMEHGVVGSAGYNAAAQKRAYLLAEAKGKMLSGAADYQTGRAINLAAQATQKYAPVVGGVASVMGAKRISTHTGAIVSDAGFMGIQHPYLIIRRPNQSLAENYNHFMGYPSNKYVKVGDCSGYNEFIRLELKGIPATDSELAEIDELLKGGVYL